MTLFEIVQKRNNRRWLYVLAAVVIIALLVAWYWHSYSGHSGTDAVISHLRDSATTTERRADAVVDATRQREVTARAQTKKRTDAMPADELCAALDRLLAEYRADDQ